MLSGTPIKASYSKVLSIGTINDPQFSSAQNLISSGTTNVIPNNRVLARAEERKFNLVAFFWL